MWAARQRDLSGKKGFNEALTQRRPQAATQQWRRWRRHNNGGSNGGGGFNPNRTFDSSGPEIKIRGSATHVYEKYLQLARDANSGGDRVMAENYLQHAEHYYRIMAAQQAQQAQYQAQQAAQNPEPPARRPAAASPAAAASPSRAARPPSP